MTRVAIRLAPIAILTFLAAQEARQPQALEPGQSVQLRLGGGAKTSVPIVANAGDFLRIEVQADAEMAAKTSLFDAAGTLVAVTPSLGGTGTKIGRAHV